MAAQFLQDYKLDPKTLNLPEPAIRFDLGCMDVFIRTPKEILFTWKGYFLSALKAAPDR